jgi:hypothetical protein
MIKATKNATFPTLVSRGLAVAPDPMKQWTGGTYAVTGSFAGHAQCPLQRDTQPQHSPLEQKE